MAPRLVITPSPQKVPARPGFTLPVPINGQLQDNSLAPRTANARFNRHPAVLNIDSDDDKLVRQSPGARHSSPEQILHNVIGFSKARPDSIN